MLPSNNIFNYKHSRCWVMIKNALGILKANFPSLRALPISIGSDVHLGHCRVIDWIHACFILYNILRDLKEDSG